MHKLTRALVIAAILLAMVVLPVSAKQGPIDRVEALKANLAANPNSQVYVVTMAADPVITYDGGEEDLAPTKPGNGHKIDVNDKKVQRYVAHLNNKHNQALQEAGVNPDQKVYDYYYAVNGFAVVLTEDEATLLSYQKDVVMVRPDEMRYITSEPAVPANSPVLTDSSPDFMGLTADGGPYDKGITGENVVVGVIDTGIWPEHPSFADDGSYGPSPIGPIPCDFGNTAQNPADAPFTCNNKLLGARQMLVTYRAIIGADPDEFDSARDDNGHGTHTASTAAGNAGVAASIYGQPLGTVSGIAPRARVVAYKGLGNLGGFGSDLAAAIDQATADGVDVINYSVGGGPSVTGSDDIAYLFAADAGIFVATSAGNSGPGDATIGGPASVPWLTTVGASTQSRFFQGTAHLGDGSTVSGASITLGTGGTYPLVDAAAAGGDLCISGTLNPAVVSGKVVLCRRGANARADKSYAVYLAGGAGMIMYNNSNTDNLFTDTHWVPSIHVDYTEGVAVKAYIASAGASATADITSGEVTNWSYAPSMTIFSSRGPDPVAEDIIKPDVTAPGLQILAGNSPYPDPGSYPGELFQAIAGTSMSSPHVAGLFALIKQAHPDWTPAMAKSALMTTAYQNVLDNDRSSAADPFDFGAGHVNPGGPWNKGSVDQPGLVYNAEFYDYLGFLCDAGPEVFANPAGTCGFLASIGVPTDAYNLNLPSIGVANLPGAITIQRTVTSVAKESSTRTYKPTVVAPPGYSVSVSPSQIALKTGESATYYVTITNTGAPAGEWFFGSLTWTDKTHNYSVYSPIAVKGALFDAPDAVSGSGEDGSASFDVQFGYTGSYSAAAHGLVPATVDSGDVVQDPDQSFNPGDGYSDSYTFNLSGAAFFRVAIPADAVGDPAIDLDVFVFDPDGNLAGSSTLGGTDEEVSFVSPMDGTWTVFVHGWQTAGPSAVYDMYSWVLSATPGGSLNIDSAPASATAGAISTIDVSWTGATGWSLGAVSHTGDVGLMGLTLVEVDNR